MAQTRRTMTKKKKYAEKEEITGLLYLIGILFVVFIIVLLAVGKNNNKIDNLQEQIDELNGENEIVWHCPPLLEVGIYNFTIDARGNAIVIAPSGDRIKCDRGNE